MWYDAKYDVPKDAKAVIISPAIVGDRFVQLTPVYKRGAKMADNAVLTTKSTSTPLELDEIYDSIDQLTVALGPGGANKQGSLTRLLDSTAANFQGQGEQFHRTIENLGKFTGTLDDNKEELFGTVRADRAVRQRAREERHHRPSLQRLARGCLRPAQGRARRPSRSAAQPRRRDAGCRGLRAGEPRHAVAQHQGAQPGDQGAGQAAGRTRPGASGRTDGTGEPVPHLQPVDRHAGHPHQRQRDPQRDHRGPGEVPVRSARAGEGASGRSRLQGTRPASAEGARGCPVVGHRVTAGSRARVRSSSSTGRSAGSWGRRDEPPQRPTNHVPARPDPACRAPDGRGRAHAERLRLLGLQPAVARRREARGQPLHRQGRVPRRHRPGAAVLGEGGRRLGRQGQGHQGPERSRRGHRRAATQRQAARQRRREDPPDEPARGEVRLARPTRQRAQRGSPRQRGRHPAEPDRSQPGGRRGPRCACPCCSTVVGSHS